MDVTPVIDGFVVDWSMEADQVHLQLESHAVAPFCARLRERAPFRIEGAQATLRVQPTEDEPGWSVDGRQLAVRVDPKLTGTILSTLTDHPQQHRWLPLPRLTLEVVPSDPPPPPPEEVRERRRAGRARWRRRLLLALLALVLLFPPGLIAFAFYYLRHVPYSIPADLRPPPPSVAAALGMGLKLKYLGVSGYELTDGKTVVLLDPTPTRPELGALLSGTIGPDTSLYGDYVHADFILVNHAHHDHALDVPALAKKTGAVVIGSRSVVNLCRSRGIPAKQTIEAKADQVLQLGTFKVVVREGHHTAIAGIEDPMSGTIPENAGELRFWEYSNDGTFAYRLEANHTSVWWHPTTTFQEGRRELEPPAGVLILGVSGEELTREKLKRMLGAAQPRWLLPTHYDNFFHPLSKGLALLPIVDLPATRDRALEIDPRLKCYVLDFGQTVHLPPDP